MSVMKSTLLAVGAALLLSAPAIAAPLTPDSGPLSASGVLQDGSGGQGRFSISASMKGGTFTGTVRDYEMTNVGRCTYPLVSLEIRLLDVSTGNLVWSASITRRGGPDMPFMGWREIHTLGELTTAVCRELLKTLPAQ